MDCSITCQRMEPVSAPAEVMEAAERLACLLVETSELQNFTRLSRAVRIDSKISEILNEMQGFTMAYQPGGLSTDELDDQLEALPLMREYRRAEGEIRGIFGMVDRLVGEIAGLPFSDNAKPRACG